jgi:hypothetical protein
MHRTEGEDYVVEDGKRRFADQNLPTVPGTKDPAESSNAFQEELCNIIEMSGGTVAATAAADRTGGWHQAYDRIFQSAVLDSNAIDNISLAKLSDGDLNITRGLSNLYLQPASLVFTNSERKTLLDYRGTRFYGTNHPVSIVTGGVSIAHNSVTVDITSLSLTPSLVAGTDNALIGDIPTGIPATCKIIGVACEYDNPAGDRTTSPCVGVHTVSGARWESLVYAMLPVGTAGFLPDGDGMTVTFYFDGLGL